MQSRSARRSAGRRRTGPGLDRDRVVAAGLRVIDRDGAGSLTMRGLGHELGVEAMSLYRYVSGREQLLEAIVARLLDDLLADLDRSDPSSWQEYMQTLAHGVRDLALAHPRMFPLIATRPPAAPWLRPPLRSVEMVEHFLATLEHFGFGDEQVVEAYRAFTSFLLGHLLLEAAARGASVSPLADGGESDGDTGDTGGDGGADGDDGESGAESGATASAVDDEQLDPDSEVRRLRPLLSEDRGAEEFTTALEGLLDRLESEVAH